VSGSSDQEKTEDPTPHRREEARKEGRVPRSQELATAALLLGGTLGLVHVGATAMAGRSTEVLQKSAGWLTAGPLSVQGATAMLRDVTTAFLLAMAPFLGVVAAVAAAVGLVQGRGVMKADAFAPKLSNINPGAGLKKLFGSQAVVALLKSVAKFALIGWVTWTVLERALPEVVGLTGGSEMAVLLAIRELTLKLILTTGAAFLVITLVDYGVEVWRYEKSLRMSKQEIVDEHKQSEGNPMVKHRMRALGQAMVRKRMLADVSKATVVVTNPTHRAVALRYDPTEGSAPVVLAMGERKLAERIKALAAASGVPMVENRPLAKALLATATVGQSIPTELFTAVAEVLAYVYRRRGKVA
jgi:flagellar biosynthetic protein FlhB